MFWHFAYICMNSIWNWSVLPFDILNLKLGDWNRFIHRIIRLLAYIVEVRKAFRQDGAIFLQLFFNRMSKAFKFFTKTCNCRWGGLGSFGSILKTSNGKMYFYCLMKIVVELPCRIVFNPARDNFCNIWRIFMCEGSKYEVWRVPNHGCIFFWKILIFPLSRFMRCFQNPKTSSKF